MLLLAGLFLSLLGSLPPGLISLSVAHTAIQRRMVAAMALAGGAAFGEFFQAWAAVALSDWLIKNAWVEQLFQWVALTVFLILGIYLFFFAPPPAPPAAGVSHPRRSAYFFNGILLSAFNMLAIPYWFVYCGWLKVSGWWVESPYSTFIFSFGVSVGTMAALYLYARLGVAILQRSAEIARKANQFVAIIFFLLGLKLLLKLLG